MIRISFLQKSIWSFKPDDFANLNRTGWAIWLFVRWIKKCFFRLGSVLDVTGINSKLIKINTKPRKTCFLLNNLKLSRWISILNCLTSGCDFRFMVWKQIRKGNFSHSNFFFGIGQKWNHFHELFLRNMMFKCVKCQNKFSRFVMLRLRWTLYTLYIFFGVLDLKRHENVCFMLCFWCFCLVLWKFMLHFTSLH